MTNTTWVSLVLSLPLSMQGVAVQAQAGRIYLEPVARVAGDSVLKLRLMLAPPSGQQVASFHIDVTYDSIMARAIRVDPHGGMQVANTNVPGSVALAGVDPRGFRAGELATLFVKPARGRGATDFALRVVELNDAAGKSLVDVVAAKGFMAPGNGARATAIKGAEPRVDSISPREGRIVRDDVLEVSVYGRGFSAVGNTIYLNGYQAAVVPSEAGGHRIRFVAPMYVRAKNSLTDIPVTPGLWSIQVENANGQSNRVRFTVREGSQ